MAELRYQPQAQTRAGTRAEIDQGLRSYMLGVYNYMASGLAVTGAVAAGTYMLAVQNGQLTPFGMTLFQSPLMWVFVLPAARSPSANAIAAPTNGAIAKIEPVRAAPMRRCASR